MPKKVDLRYLLKLYTKNIYFFFKKTLDICFKNKYNYLVIEKSEVNYGKIDIRRLQMSGL